jgi:hypothetical protein
MTCLTSVAMAPDFPETERMIYIFHLAETPAGSTVVSTEWNGGTLAEIGSSCERDLCRTLVRLGAEDGPVEARRGGRVCWTGRLYAIAARTLSEGDHGFQTGWYAPHPRAVARGDTNPLLMAVVAVERARAANAKAARTASGENPVADTGRRRKAAGGARCVLKNAGKRRRKSASQVPA